MERGSGPSPPSRVLGGSVGINLLRAGLLVVFGGVGEFGPTVSFFLQGPSLPGPPVSATLVGLGRAARDPARGCAGRAEISAPPKGGSQGSTSLTR